MRENEKNLLYQYYFAKEMRLKDDIATYEDRYKIRYCDEVDHLESNISIVIMNINLYFTNIMAYFCNK